MGALKIFSFYNFFLRFRAKTGTIHLMVTSTMFCRINFHESEQLSYPPPPPNSPTHCHTVTYVQLESVKYLDYLDARFPRIPDGSIVRFTNGTVRLVNGVAGRALDSINPEIE